MAKTNVQVQGISEALGNASGSFVALSKVAAPFTTITNRALMTDLANDLLPRMGIERFQTQTIQELQDEFGPAGERVFKPVNDIHNQIRFVGDWIANNDTYGTRPNSATSGNYIEVSFYGTGINIALIAPAGRNITVNVDGTGYGANIIGTVSDTLGNQNYPANIIFNGARGLSLGFHTVSFRSNSTAGFNPTFFEILNENLSLKTTPGAGYSGGVTQYIQSLDSQSYNSNFASGILGTKGGRVVVYAHDGQIKKALTPTDTTQLNLTSANHTNEEIVRVYNWREFGTRKVNDFSTLEGSVSDRAFTLEDNTTTLIGNDVLNQSSIASIEDTVAIGALNGHIVFQFVGTGLDVKVVSNNPSVDTHTVTVDNVNIGNLTLAAGNTLHTRKIVSGLPYGTHVVRIVRTTNAGAGIFFKEFKVYGPKKPTIPDDAVELADYNIMASYVACATESVLDICTGVLRKTILREANYSGAGWTYSAIDAGGPLSGFNVQTTGGANVGNYVEYTFMGTGLAFRINSEGASTYTISVDGATNYTVANGVFWSSALSTSTTAGLGFDPATGVIQNNTGVARVTLNGMNYTKHTVRVTLTSSTGGGLYPEAFDIITPIHSPKSSLPAGVQQMLPVGSCGVGDSRSFVDSETLEIPNWASSEGVESCSTSVTANIGTGGVPIEDMTCIVKTSGGPIEINFAGTFTHNITGASGDAVFNLMVDGVFVRGTGCAIDSSNAGYYMHVKLTAIAQVSAGVHIVQAYYGKAGAASTVTFPLASARILTVKELK